MDLKAASSSFGPYYETPLVSLWSPPNQYSQQSSFFCSDTRPIFTNLTTQSANYSNYSNSVQQLPPTNLISTQPNQVIFFLNTRIPKLIPKLNYKIYG